MGLADIGSRATTQSSSSDDKEQRMPYVIIWHTEEPDEWTYDKYPDVEPIQYIKKNGQWVTRRDLKARKRIIWSPTEWKTLKKRCREEYQIDLDEVLRQDPERALQAVKWAAQQKEAPEIDLRPKCGVCSKRHNRLSGDYFTVEGRVVCGRHPVQDLHEHDII